MSFAPAHAICLCNVCWSPDDQRRLEAGNVAGRSPQSKAHVHDLLHARAGGCMHARRAPARGRYGQEPAFDVEQGQERRCEWRGQAQLFGALCWQSQSSLMPVAAGRNTQVLRRGGWHRRALISLMEPSWQSSREMADAAGMPIGGVTAHAMAAVSCAGQRWCRAAVQGVSAIQGSNDRGSNDRGSNDRGSFGPNCSRPAYAGHSQEAS